MDELTMSQFASKEDLLEARLERAEKEIETINKRVSVLEKALRECDQAAFCEDIQDTGVMAATLRFVRTTAKNALLQVDDERTGKGSYS